MMHMSYWFGTDIGDFLFKGLTITTSAGFISTCCGLISLAVLLEGAKIGLLSARQKEAHKARTKTPGISAEDLSLLANDRTESRINCRNKRLISFTKQLILFLSRDILSYVLMLSIMTFNGYFTLSIALGAGIGFFVFGPKLIEIALIQRQEQCLYQHCGETSAGTDDSQDNASLLEVGQGISAIVCDYQPTTTTHNALPMPLPVTETLAVAQIHSSQEQHL